MKEKLFKFSKYEYIQYLDYWVAHGWTSQPNYRTMQRDNQVAASLILGLLT